MTSANEIKPNTPVVCSNNAEFATVDRLEGSHAIKLKKDASGQHHYIPISWVRSVDTKVHVDRPGDQAMREWAISPLMLKGDKAHTANTDRGFENKIENHSRADIVQGVPDASDDTKTPTNRL